MSNFENQGTSSNSQGIRKIGEGTFQRGEGEGRTVIKLPTSKEGWAKLMEKADAVHAQYNKRRELLDKVHSGEATDEDIAQLNFSGDALKELYETRDRERMIRKKISESQG